MYRLALAFVLFAGSLSAQSPPVSVQSPDGRIIATVDAGAINGRGGKLTYSVSFAGKPLLSRSSLLLYLEGQTPLGPNARVMKVTRSQKDEGYHLITGRASQGREYYNGVTVELLETNDTTRTLLLDARVYNDAFAFRYRVPAQPALKSFRLAREATEFRFAKDATTYSLVLPHFRSMYESEFLKLPISAFANQGGVRSEVLIGLPMLLDVPGVGWAAILEADLRGYSSMYLVNPGGGWSGTTFESRLAPQIGATNLCVTNELPAQTPWRVVLVADDPGRFIESTTLASLNPPSEITDTSWIRPGKATWDWWSGSIGPQGAAAYSTETMKYYVDFAAQSGFEYMLIDAGWYTRDNITRPNGRVDVPEVVRYAASKGVKIWIWLHYSATLQQMDEAFPIFEKWGVAGLKIDFVERDDQEGVGFYYRVAKKAAEHHLMVDFHGCTKPWGIHRTYPNVLGYEAVLGMEQAKGGGRDNPDHHVMLPFTRMLAGLMDYTPGAFDNVTRDSFVARGKNPMVMGTRAHQLAMYVVFEAPFQMVSDKPSAYQGEAAFEFIKAVPASWDETRVLNGVPGEFVTIARRRGKHWFIGCMTGWTPRQVNLPLTFLPDGAYEAEIYADGVDAATAPKHVDIRHQMVSQTSVLAATLAPGGGCAVHLHPTR